MSKVKNYYWDQAEDYIDSLVSKITSNNMTVEEAVAEAKTTDQPALAVSLRGSRQDPSVKIKMRFSSSFSFKIIRRFAFQGMSLKKHLICEVDYLPLFLMHALVISNPWQLYPLFTASGSFGAFPGKRDQGFVIVVFRAE